MRVLLSNTFNNSDLNVSWLKVMSSGFCPLQMAAAKAIAKGPHSEAA